jgi:ornithine cyclodeaminase/alanine dehydrogenase-like protein (mu-crystallin family)
VSADRSEEGPVADCLDDTMLYLNRREVEQACAEIDPVAVIAGALALHSRGEAVAPDEAYLAWTNPLGEGARSLNMPGWLGGSAPVVGTKIINGNPANSARGLARASGLTLLFDPISARISCVLEAAHISSLRTASVTALSADLFRGAAVESLAVIGAGALAAAHLSLLPHRLPALRHVRLFDLDRARAGALWEQFAGALAQRDVCLSLVDSAEEAIRPAQLIVPVTTTTTGYIPYQWLQPGAILVNISLDDALPDVALRAGKLFVDDWHLVKTDSRRLLGRMYRDGLIDGPDAPPTGRARRVDAQLGDVVLGARPGRTSTDEVVLVNPFGLSIEDVALAAEVHATARRLGIGSYLER